MVRRFVAALLFSCIAVAPLTAKDVYLPVTGSIGVFRTDARIVNPSGEKDITITATFEPVNGSNISSRTATVTVPKRQQLVLDDVVGALFPGTSVLGAIRLTSNDDFIATARIYATVTGGTAGQGYTAIDVGQAKQKGVLQQLRATGGSGQAGTSRSNLGFVNPGATPAAVTLRLYDKSSNKVSEQNLTIPARSSLSPANYFAAATGDFADAWASFSSDVPVIAYASIIDNGTTDPTFLAAVEDTGSDPIVAPPATKNYEVTARQFSFSASGPGASDDEIRVKVGDRVKLRVTSVDVTHGIAIEGNFFGGTILAPDQTREFEFTADRAGTFTFFCTVSSCGSGHSSMQGKLIVEP